MEEHDLRRLVELAEIAYQDKIIDSRTVEDIRRWVTIEGLRRTPCSDGHSSQWDMPIEYLELSARAFNCLVHSNAKTVGDVTKLNAYELLRMPNFGRRSLAEIEQALAKVNLTLARP